jgi:hypothetical protein
VVVDESHPAVRIDLSHPTDQQFELVLVKDVHQFEQQHVPESVHGCTELLRYATHDPMCDNEVDIIFLVYLHHRQISTSRPELHYNMFTEAIFSDWECLIKHAHDVVLPEKKTSILKKGID